MYHLELGSKEYPETVHFLCKRGSTRHYTVSLLHVQDDDMSSPPPGPAPRGLVTQSS